MAIFLSPYGSFKKQNKVNERILIYCNTLKSSTKETNSTDLSAEEVEEESGGRETWTGTFDFFLSALGYAGFLHLINFN